MERPSYPDALTTLHHSITRAELERAMTIAKLPIHEYGTGVAKSIDHLLSEINEREAVITLDTRGNIHRNLRVLMLDVICQYGNGTYLLKEDRQVFADGREKTRTLDSSLGEKLRQDESPITAVSRALQEELGITTPTQVKFIGEKTKTFIGDAFPGLETTYQMYHYTSIIPEDAFNPDGYVEVQPDKSSYFSWKLISLVD